MVRTAHILMLAAPAFLLSACGTPNRGLESIHQPIVERNDYAFDVATSDRGLAPGEAGRLAGWMASLRVGYGDRVAIDTASAYDAGVRDDIAVLAARYGLLVSDEAPVTNSPVAAGTARVLVSRMRASVPSCPDHSRVSGIDLEGHTNSNYGCGINSNLAAMVARPEDLVRGQPGADVSDPAVSYKAIDVMRRSLPTGANGVKTESTKAR